jgi:hypothetical protein
LVRFTGSNRTYGDDPELEVLYGIEKTTQANDPQSFASFLMLMDVHSSHSSTNPYLISAVGNGDMWVVDEGEDLGVGDYLISSGVAGHAMKDTGAYVVSHVVARATEPVDWSTVIETEPVSGKKHKKITVTFEVFDKYNPGFDLTFSKTEEATALEPAKDSYRASFLGSAWDSVSESAVDRKISLRNVMTGLDEYRLSLEDNDGNELAYFGSNGDVALAGKLYLSDRGTLQENRYIYYDGDTGPGGDFMRTNAAGWATGSYDFAEMFPSSDTLEAGELVMIDTRESTHFRRAMGGREEAPRYLLAGVVSTRPGFLAGLNEEGHYPIALAGRVPTRVVGPVSIGDPITVSLTDGVGVVADEPTYIVGYALEPKDTEGPGEVTVFIKTGWWNGQSVVSAEGAPTRASLMDLEGQPIIRIGALEGVENAWSINSDGHMVLAEIEAEKVTADEYAVKATDERQTIGEAVIPVGESRFLIENAAIRYNSRIFVTFFANVEGSWWISQRRDGAFEVTLSKLAPTDLPFEYWILNVVDDRTPPTPTEETVEETPAEEEEVVAETGSGSDTIEVIEDTVEEEIPVDVTEAEMLEVTTSESETEGLEESPTEESIEAEAVTLVEGTS